MKPTRNLTEYAVGPFRSQHVAPVGPYLLLSRQIRIGNRVCVFLCQKNHNRKLRSESSFLFPLLPTVQFDVVHQHLDLRHKQHTNSCGQHVLNLHVLVSLCSLDSLGSLWLWEFLLPRVPHLLRFQFRHLHEIPQLVRCHHQLVLHLDSKFSLDLRAHCSAIFVSRLLTVLRKTMISIVHIVGLC